MNDRRQEPTPRAPTGGAPTTELTDAALDAAQGGLLLPAVQSAREAARRADTSSTQPGGVNVALGDGSVRF